MPADHFTVTIELDGKKVRVDRAIAKQVIELNNEGFKTTNSCQGDIGPTDGYIAFDGWLTNRNRLKIESIMGFQSPLPTFTRDEDGWVDVNPDFPFWELSMHHSFDEPVWIIRFNRISEIEISRPLAKRAAYLLREEITRGHRNWEEDPEWYDDLLELERILKED